MKGNNPLENAAQKIEKSISGAIKIDEKEVFDHLDTLVRHCRGYDQLLAGCRSKITPYFHNKMGNAPIQLAKHTKRMYYKEVAQFL